MGLVALAVAAALCDTMEQSDTNELLLSPARPAGASQPVQVAATVTAAASAAAESEAAARRSRTSSRRQVMRSCTSVEAHQRIKGKTQCYQTLERV